jgi:hypothetical protein
MTRLPTSSAAVEHAILLLNEDARFFPYRPGVGATTNWCSALVVQLALGAIA